MMAVSTGTTEALFGVALPRRQRTSRSCSRPASTISRRPASTAKTYSLANIAALIAADAAPASYVFQVGFALEVGVTPEEILGLLVALNPTVGNVRIVSAAAEIAFALGIDLDDEEG